MEILGVKIDNLTEDDALQKAEEFINGKKQRHIVTVNPEFLVETQKDREFREILNQADLSLADGIGLIFASKFLRQPLKQRITGVDLMEKICQRAAQKKWAVFLLGGRRGAAEKAADNLRKKYLGLRIQHQELPLNFEGSLWKIEGRPRILFVALNAPKQEKWISSNLKKNPSIKLAMGVGGSFDFISGRVQRAPKFLRTIGAEWLWRLFRQPWRIKRIFKAVVVFPWLVIKSK